MDEFMSIYLYFDIINEKINIHHQTIGYIGGIGWAMMVMLPFITHKTNTLAFYKIFDEF